MEEDRIVVVRGELQLRAEREMALEHFQRFVKDVSDLKATYMYLGYHLWEFDNCKYYEDFGYDNLYDFCNANISMEKTQVMRCINVWYRFCEKDNSKGCKTHLADRYKDYSYSQLVEMLPLDYEHCETITPKMSVRSIREYKKALKRRT